MNAGVLYDANRSVLLYNIIQCLNILYTFLYIDIVRIYYIIYVPIGVKFFLSVKVDFGGAWK